MKLKAGDTVLVYDELGETPLPKVFVACDRGADYPIICADYEGDDFPLISFNVTRWKYILVPVHLQKGKA